MVPTLLVLLACKPDDGKEAASPAPIVAVTFNTGAGAPAPGNPDFTDQLAEYSDQYYGHGLAWVPAVEAVRAFLAEVQPDAVAFQEIFYSGDCPDIPEEAPGDEWRTADDWPPSCACTIPRGGPPTSSCPAPPGTRRTSWSASRRPTHRRQGGTRS